jgi:hypothetical protein
MIEVAIVREKVAINFPPHHPLPQPPQAQQQNTLRRDPPSPLPFGKSDA